jgi:hypothetical protein
MNIIIRPFNAEKDSGVIYSSFPKGVYYGSLNEIKIKKSLWFKNFFHYIQLQLHQAKVSIACLDNDENTILGYCIINGKTLEWVYVKEMFRKSGIAKLLLKNQTFDLINKDNLTRIGESILTNHPQLEKKNERTEDQGFNHADTPHSKTVI